MGMKQKQEVVAQMTRYLESLGFKNGQDFNLKLELAGQRNKNGTVAMATTGISTGVLERRLRDLPMVLRAR